MRPSFKKRPSHSLSQLAEHLIEHTHDWELREHWIGLRARFFPFSSHGSADSSSELFHEHTTFPQPFLNWPSIQLNIHTTENCANTELGWGRGAFSYDSVDSSSELFHEHTTFPQETIFLQLFLNWPSIQLNIHTTKNYDDDDSSDWRVRFGAFHQ